MHLHDHAGAGEHQQNRGYKPWLLVNNGYSVTFPVGSRFMLPFLLCPGVTLNAGVRRRPNCFNLVFQLEFLCRSGLSKEHGIAGLEAIPNNI